MKKSLLILAFVLVSVGAAAAQQVQPGPDMKEKSLYSRLGGYDALAAVTDDFLGRLEKSKILGRFFTGVSDDSAIKLRQHVIDFLCMATGGPCKYGGRDMKVVHTGLEITEADWDENVKLLKETLAKFNVPAKEQGEVLAAVSGLKKDIVEKK
jgi:hemoglobin